MKPRRIDPIWALAFGYLVAPIVCIFNGFIFSAIFADTSARGAKGIIPYASITISTMVMGLVTMRLIRIWNNGNCVQARLWSMECGIVCAAFWIWLGQMLLPNRSLSPSMMGALSLPFLWSLGFFVFALFARPPKN